MAFVVQIGKVPDENGENRSRNMDMEKHPAMKHDAVVAGPWSLFRDVLILLGRKRTKNTWGRADTDSCDARHSELCPSRYRFANIQLFIFARNRFITPRFQTGPRKSGELHTQTSPWLLRSSPPPLCAPRPTSVLFRCCRSTCRSCQ